MKILVTGGLGFIGLHFVRRMAAAHEILVVDNETYAAHLPEELPTSVDFLHADICSISKLDLDGDFDWIVHFAAESHVDNSIRDATPFWHSNVEGTYELTRFALRHGIKFFHVSTDEVFGEWVDSYPLFDEHSPYRPNNMYAVSKAASDQIVRAQARSHGLPYIITNCGNNYGAGQHAEKFIPRVLDALNTGGGVTLHAGGRPIRDWIYVGDHVAAIEFLMGFGALNDTYVISARDAHSIKDVCEMAGVPYELKAAGRAGVDMGYRLNPAKLERQGWRPQVTIKEWLSA